VGDFIDGLKGKFINFAVRKIKKMVPEYHLPTAKTLPEVMTLGSDRAFTPVPQKLDDIAFLQYTGGTTGVSKGAMLTHGNLVANLLQIEAWKASAILPGQERIFTALPLYHIFALTVNCLVFMHVGALNILVTNARDLDSVIKAIKQYEPTFMTGVNTLFNALLNRPDFADLDFSKLKVAAAGGMAVQSDVVNRWKNTTGSLLMEGYGLTEAAPVTHFNPMDGRDRIGSIGLPMPGTDVKIINDNEEEVPFGEAGELCIKGPQVMAGYWNRPDETAKTIKNGWLHTGDIAIAFPDGFFKIVDRKKDMILVSGFNVYPNEIEEVISAHPKVKEVCAIGVPDEHSGEAVKVFIVRNGNLSVAELESYCKENFTGYKRPKYYEFRDELPKSNVGKLLRRPLREEELQKRK
jgi:long-chain acyl-CoA synthetase